MTSEVISNEVLVNQIDNLSSQVNKLEAKLDAYATHFITAEVYELKHRELSLMINVLTARVDQVTKGDTAKLWVLGTLSAAGGIVLAFLVQFYLGHLGAK